MNKKIIALIVAIVVIAVGCIGFWVISSNNKTESNNNSNNNSNTNTTENQNDNETQEENTNDDDDNGTTNDKKVAIIYFSATGTTERVAGYIKDATNGDLIEIVPKDEYTSADLNYNNNNSRSTKEQNDESARPEIKNTINMDNYDVIFLGYPIWWGDAPRIILTFLDSHNLDGKTVIPFCTSGGSGISSSVSYFRSHYKNVNFEDGATLNNGESAVKNWVNGLNY